MCKYSWYYVHQGCNENGKSHSSKNTGNGNSFSTQEECNSICSKLIPSLNKKGLEIHLLHAYLSDTNHTVAIHTAMMYYSYNVYEYIKMIY